MKRTILVIVVLLVGIMAVSSCAKEEVRIETFAYSETGDMFKGQLIVKGLEPNTAYMLCMNGRVGRPGNESLKKFGIWGGEGYYDFMEARTDSKGVLDKSFAVKLPEGSYEVKFAIKEIKPPGNEWPYIEISSLVKFEIR